MTQTHGPVMLDLISMDLSQEEKDILQHPLVGGVILFTRNYKNPEQLTQLCKEIRIFAKKPILIAVDQEGGRVQRFKEGFTLLPAMGQIGQLYENDSQMAHESAEACGWVMAAELRATGIDLSFAPVVDLNKKLNTVIADRAFHMDPVIVTSLAKSVIKGMKTAGMAATIKHFPGHGSVNLDSHLAMPIDNRELNQILAEDMCPFVELINDGIPAVMVAHIIFPEVDAKPVGFSTVWLQNILRQKLRFSGMIFSDDLNMEGASFAGDYADRAQAALTAGCDMVLICNNRSGAIKILDQLPQTYQVNHNKFESMQGQFSYRWESLRNSADWKKHITKATLERITNAYSK